VDIKELGVKSRNIYNKKNLFEKKSYMATTGVASTRLFYKPTA
jgi:hypothetical protein